MTKNQAKQIDNLLQENGVDLVDHVENYIDEDNDVDSYDELFDILNEQGAFDHEVIYYSSAMEYLRENDASLKTALELAHDMGFALDNLNSETLASILKRDITIDDFYDLEKEIEYILEN